MLTETCDMRYQSQPSDDTCETNAELSLRPALNDENSSSRKQACSAELLDQVNLIIVLIVSCEFHDITYYS